MAEYKPYLYERFILDRPLEYFARDPLRDDDFSRQPSKLHKIFFGDPTKYPRFVRVFVRLLLLAAVGYGIVHFSSGCSGYPDAETSRGVGIAMGEIDRALGVNASCNPQLWNDLRTKSGASNNELASVIPQLCAEITTQEVLDILGE